MSRSLVSDKKKNHHTTDNYKTLFQTMANLIIYFLTKRVDVNLNNILKTLNLH